MQRNGLNGFWNYEMKTRRWYPGHKEISKYFELKRKLK